LLDQGGSIAAICGLDLRERFNDLGLGVNVFLNVISIGEPRIGNKEFAQYYQSTMRNDKVVRIINDNDIVPQLPKVFMGYYHHTTEIWIVNGEAYACDDKDGEDPQCSKSLAFGLRAHVQIFDILFGPIC
jgi:predicted lipase